MRPYHRPAVRAGVRERRYQDHREVPLDVRILALTAARFRHRTARAAGCAWLESDTRMRGASTRQWAVYREHFIAEWRRLEVKQRPFARALLRDIHAVEAEWRRAVTASQFSIAKIINSSAEALAQRRKLATYRIASLEKRLAKLVRLIEGYHEQTT